MTDRRGSVVLTSFVDALKWEDALSRISAWARQRESRVVCVCNVHSLVTACFDPLLGAVLRCADMVTPDGMPVAWMMRSQGVDGQPRIDGPDLMWRYCEQAALSGDSVFFYGSTDHVLREMKTKLEVSLPSLRVAGFYAPPFRDLTEQEDAGVVEMLNQSGASVVFVALGCPKQEIWMAQHRGRIRSVMIGVGAAFAYHADVIKRAPRWMQKTGLEWFYRFLSEPRRLWRRYLVTNTLFIFFVLTGLVTRRLRPYGRMQRQSP